MASASAMPPSRLAGFCCAAAIADAGDEGGGRGEEVVVVGVDTLACSASFSRAPILNLQMAAT